MHELASSKTAPSIHATRDSTLAVKFHKPSFSSNGGEKKTTVQIGIKGAPILMPQPARNVNGALRHNDLEDWDF
ncbi:hypothetical protein PsorP6_009979 [Peronosclerospora sorghi]|uniref:Uncharacterized protein n=1 Tax=Peronosclerospora sorghi TaxID=230839 RepID=A0ACC0VV81_9STRA|nr:hypothetical protein PsorP6_009979 [Peronosclerospora sorghi]